MREQEVEDVCGLSVSRRFFEVGVEGGRWKKTKRWLLPLLNLTPSGVTSPARAAAAIQGSSAL